MRTVEKQGPGRVFEADEMDGAALPLARKYGMLHSAGWVLLAGDLGWVGLDEQSGEVGKAFHVYGSRSDTTNAIAQQGRQRTGNP